MAEKISTFDFLNSINESNNDILTKENEDSYQTYLINHYLSGTLDTIFLANEMNNHFFLDKRLNYDFLRLSVTKRRRFTKWLKPDKSEFIDTIKKYYKINTKKAIEIIELFTEADINEMKEELELGGINS